MLMLISGRLMGMIMMSTRRPMSARTFATSTAFFAFEGRHRRGCDRLRSSAYGQPDASISTTAVPARQRRSLRLQTPRPGDRLLHGLQRKLLSGDEICKEVGLRCVRVRRWYPHTFQHDLVYNHPPELSDAGAAHMAPLAIVWKWYGDGKINNRITGATRVTSVWPDEQ